jgi:regulator of ribonuclease activity A
MTTADISDILHPNVQYLAPIYKSYGKKTNFAGRIWTIKCFEDNSLVRQTLATPGENRVLVVDAGGSKRCAMLGDNLATLAIDNNWAGIVIYGLIRDSAIINTLPIGVKALGTLPLKSVKNNTGAENIIVQFSNVTFTPDKYLYADEDGVIVVDNPIT